MKGRKLLFVACCLSVVCAFGDVPKIRHVSESPFKGARADESAWAKADVCTRFVEVNTYDVALAQSEARLLFDDRNLYVSLKGLFDGKYDRGDRKNGLSSVNNFEFFIRMPSADSLQVVVDEFGRLYVSKAKSDLVNSGVTAKVTKDKGFWTADVTIPFKTIGVAAPAKDVTAKVGIFRWNINVHEREKLWNSRGVASGFTPNNYNYHVPDTWADMTFTRTTGESRRVVGPTFGARVNLIPNPDFNVPNDWTACGKAAYAETMAMSGEWIYRSSGKDYQVVQFGAHDFKPGTRYTLVVKARCFGEGSGLRAFQLVRDEDGRVREGTCITMLTPLGPDMHEYYLPFTSAAAQSWTLVLYKVDNRADDTGIEVASVRCYEGEISSFEIRKLSRPGRMAIVPGTEIPVTPNPIGRFPKRLKVLAFVNTDKAVREPAEIFAGTGADLDVLVLSEGAGSDIYSTWDDEKAISDRTEKGLYDLVMVPVRGAEKIGKEMAKHIRACVEKGGGLYLEAQPKGYGHLGALVKDAKGGILGKGCIVMAKMAGGYRQYLPMEPDRRDAVSLFPADKGRQRVAVAAWRAAVPAAANAPAARTETETFAYAGKDYVFVRKLDAKGATLDWTETATPVKGPCLGTFSDNGKISTVVITGDVSEVNLAWAFRDFSGRVLAAAEVPAAAKVSFRVPREKLYTNFGGIRLALKKNGREIDVRGEGIFVRDNDRQRLMDDYTPAMWPGDGEPDEMSQLEDIGIRSSIIACACALRPAATIARGFGVGSGWLGDETIFQGRPQKSNVRARNFNTREFRERMSKAVRQGEALATREYGLLDSALCDEPNLSAPGRADELDAHPENLAEYRVRMRKKYGTIAEYNRRHETAHKSFADLGQALQADARRTKKYAEFIEWRNFNVDRWCEAIRFISDNARAVDDAPFTMCNSFGQSALSGNDYYKLLTRAGLGFSTEYTAMVYFGRNPIYNFDEFYRSFRPDMRLWGWTGYFYSRNAARFMPWWTACHRYGGFGWFCAMGAGYNIIDPATYARTVDGEDLRQSILDTRLLDGFGKVLTCWPWAARDVAIYYSHDSMLLSTILGTETKNGEIAAVGPLHDYMYSRQGVQYTVEDLLYQHDFVAPEQVVSQKRLATCKALLMPRILAMSDAEVRAVKDFLKKGGRMMCDALPGDYDELGVKRAENPFAGLKGVTVHGKNFNDLDRDSRVAVKGFLESACAKRALACDGMVGHPGREAMHYVSGAADLYAIIRMGGRSEDDDALTFRFAKKGHVYDVVTRKYLGETDRATSKVVKCEGAAFAVLPARIRGIGIEAPASVVRGEDLKLVMAVRTEDVSPEYVLHVEVLPPSGKARFHFKRNLMTRSGRAELAFPMALTDAEGEWSVRVTEPLTGVTDVRKFNVR